MIGNAKESGFFDPKEKVSRHAKKLELERIETKKEEGEIIEPLEEIEDIALDDEPEIYKIEVDAKHVGNLPKLKEILTKAKGPGVKVEIHVGGKRIKVPFEVAIDKKVEKEIARLVE
ncbi:MAG: hypothetical protein ACD_65C00086G0002 [uncultured bacterium]|nr:MAG: hypothetical protein ACD_65C00086G0002 [uncultured bacterium]